MTPVSPDWFGGRNSAVSLTFDDGMDSHLEAVIPALDARGMAGTFYVKTDDAERLERFRDPQRRGHEIGNHTVHHWCSRAHRSEADATGLEDLTLDDMAAELDDSDRRLRGAFVAVPMSSPSASATRATTRSSVKARPDAAMCRSLPGASLPPVAAARTPRPTTLPFMRTCGVCGRCGANT